MRLTGKNILISFLLCLVIFCVIMAAVGVSIYRGSISVRTREEPADVFLHLPHRVYAYDFEKTALYYRFDTEGELEAAVFVGLCHDKTAVITPLEASLFIPYGNGIFQLPNLCCGGDVDQLTQLVASLVGVTPDEKKPVTIEDGEGEPCQRLVKQLLAELSAYTPTFVNTVTDEDGIVDITATASRFFISETK